MPRFLPDTSSLEGSSPARSAADDPSSHDAAAGRSAHGNESAKKLVYMTNQIGAFFKSQDGDTAPAKIAEHIRKFWDPRMRKAILDHVAAGGAGLDPVARQAIDSLRVPPGS